MKKMFYSFVFLVASMVLVGCFGSSSTDANNEGEVIKSYAGAVDVGDTIALKFNATDSVL